MFCVWAWFGKYEKLVLHSILSIQGLTERGKFLPISNLGVEFSTPSVEYFNKILKIIQSTIFLLLEVGVNGTVKVEGARRCL